VSAQGIFSSVLVGKSLFTTQRGALLALIVGAAVLVGLRTSRPLKQAGPASRATTNAAADAPRQWTSRAEEAQPSDRVDVDALAREFIERGKAALADGDFQAGFDSYRRALEYAPTAETYGLVGDLYLRAAAAGEAAFHLRRAAELDPNNADRWLALANAYILQTDLGAAWKAIDRAKEIEPELIVERDRNNFVVRGHAG
jgi:tetratricopeptide (TPR) repeat protein